MNKSRKGTHEKRIIMLMALASLLLVTACAPQEKTLILERSTQDDAGENERLTEDFTVKKIYTYDYETNPALERSAFLGGCGEYKVRVIAQEEQEDGSMPVGRTVDYRYGFYDLLGESETPWKMPQSGQSEFWGLWSSEEENGEAEEDIEESREDTAYYLYTERLQPSPDGKEILVYAAGENAGGLCYRVWLYDLETQRARTLYRGAEAVAEAAEGGPAGSFSESGRWVTFDVTGTSSGSMIAIYDCRKEWPADDADVEWMEVGTASDMCPPDRTLHAVSDKYTRYWTAELFDHADEPGYLCIMETSAYSPQIFMHYMSDEGLSFMSQYYLYGNLSNTMPHFRYEMDEEEMRVYYFEDFSYLRSIDTIEGTTVEPTAFEDSVLDFIRLDSGELLALTVPQEVSYPKKMPYQVNSLPYIQMGWSIGAVDLYLFSADGGVDGTLLYKNLRNVVAMEYDAESRRILLETYEDERMSRRHCIILEL